MEKVKKVMVMLLFASTMFVFSACGEDEKELQMLVGTWTENRSGTYKSRVTFSSNGTYRTHSVFNSNNGDWTEFRGTWSYDSDSRTLVINRQWQDDVPNNHNYTGYVQTLTNTSLVIIWTNGDSHSYYK